GKPVSCATSTTLSPAAPSADAVPPVDRISTLCTASAFASSTRPLLSDTEISARPTLTISSAIGPLLSEMPFCCGAIARFAAARNAPKGHYRPSSHEKVIASSPESLMQPGRLGFSIKGETPTYALLLPHWRKAP